MKQIAWMLSALALVGCATSRVKDSSECARRTAFQRGVSDATMEKLVTYAPPKSCQGDARAQLFLSYHEGFESVRARRLAQGRGPAGTLRVKDGYGVPSGKRSWVCEVEASQKIFTGEGLSRQEAVSAARNTCSSHFQSSYCRKAECKKSL